MSLYEILPALDLTQSVHAKICIEMHQGSNLKFPEYFDRACDEIRMELQTENFFGSLMSTRLMLPRFNTFYFYLSSISHLIACTADLLNNL